VWAALAHQRALVEEANKRLSQKSVETDELRVANAAVREEVAQAWEAEAKAREDATRAQEEAAKAREDLAPLLARVKELEEDIALVGAQRDALNIQVGMASTRVRTLEGEVMMLTGMVQERDAALSGAGREVEALRVALHDKDEALRASEKTCGELRNEVMGLQTHSEGKPLVMFWPWRRGPWLMLTQCLCFRVGEAAACGSGDGHLVPEPLRGRGQADSVALGRYHLGV
jgi:chromosome segregation ATPase